eukprot:9474989-Pyramimonas_sp.AAC.2
MVYRARGPSYWAAGRTCLPRPTMAEMIHNDLRSSTCAAMSDVMLFLPDAVQCTPMAVYFSCRHGDTSSASLRGRAF